MSKAQALEMGFGTGFQKASFKGFNWFCSCQSSKPSNYIIFTLFESRTSQIKDVLKGKKRKKEKVKERKKDHLC